MAYINKLRSEDLGILEKYDLPLLDALTPQKRREMTTTLIDAGTLLISRMTNLHEGGVHVDREVIADRAPMIKQWANTYSVLDEKTYDKVLNAYGYKKNSKNEQGCYLPEEKKILVKNPINSWDSLSLDQQNNYRANKGLESIDEAKDDYATTILDTELLEEFIHQIAEVHSIMDQHILNNEATFIDKRTISFFKEAMTKKLVADILITQKKSYIPDEVMTDLINRLSYQELAEIVFFGSNDAKSTIQVLSTVQNALLNEHPNMSLDQILGENGYLLNRGK